MPSSDPVQVYLILPKILETILFLINILLINKRSRKLKWRQKTLLDRLFLTGLTGWLVYIFLDIFIFIVAPLSISPSFNDASYIGYDTTHPSLFMANVFRDIAMFGALVISFAYFFAGFTIKFGEKRTIKMFINKKIDFLIITIFIILIAGDGISVSVRDGEIFVDAIWNGFAGFTLFLVISLFVLAGVFLTQVFNQMKKEDTNPEFQKRINYIRYGILFMGLGHFYWLVLGVLQGSFTWLFNPFMRVFFHFIGHLIWMLSPIFIYLGLKQKGEGTQ